MDFVGIGLALAIGSFISLVFAAIDRLLLKRQVSWLSDRATHWYFFFDEMRIPNLPKIVLELLRRFSRYILWVAAPLTVLPIVVLILVTVFNIESLPQSDLWFWLFAVGVLCFVFYGIIILLAAASRRGLLLLGILLVAGIIGLVIYFANPSFQDPETEAEALAGVFGYLLLLILAAPLILFLGVLLGLSFLLFSFWVFKNTTCHLLELSVERKTIFAHLGVFIGLIVGIGKFAIEMVKLI